MRFLDVKTDFAFKKVFGSSESKDILISFLNSLIDFDDESTITDLEIVDPYQLPLLKGMKDSFVDVKAKLSTGKTVIIEMQVLNVEGFEKRVLYNAAKCYSSQLQKAEAYDSLEPVIALTITDFVMFGEFEKVISYFRLLEKKELTEYRNDIELIFIELPKFNKNEDELDSISDKWIHFIKRAGSLEYIPRNMDEGEFIKAFNIANKAGLSDEELEAQDKRLDFIYLQKSSIEKASRLGEEKGFEKGHERGLKKGIEEGIEKGIEKGKREDKIETVLRSIQAGLDHNTIAQITGLSKKEIEDILREKGI